jgi:fermentation-respiration switch protein FrsA (DUF1100 family)
LLIARSLVTPVVLLVLCLLGYWGLLFCLQRWMLFPAPPVAGAPPRPPDARQIWLTIPGAGVEAWYLAPFEPGQRRAPLLIFAHGNGELIDYWATEFNQPRTWGMGILLLEYPGYGRSGGAPSQETVVAAILAAFDWAAAQPDIDPARIVGYGRSLGGAAVAALIGQRPVAGLILESTFTSVRAFASRFAAPRLLVRDPFDVLACVRRYGGPLLILHGERDTVIPLAHGRALAEAQAQAEFHSLPCGHNDCPPSWAVVKKFLARCDLLDTAGKGQAPPAG